MNVGWGIELEDSRLRDLAAVYGDAWRTACGECAQQPSTPCVNLDDLAHVLVLESPHAARIGQLILPSDHGCGQVTEKQFDAAAAEYLGL